MEKCVGCMRCTQVCYCHYRNGGKHVMDFANCSGCGRCAEVCPANALEIIGRLVSASGIVNIALRDKPFFNRTGGGITLSGGEPLAHTDFVIAVLGESKRAGLHTCIETSGFAQTEEISRLVETTDIFLFDIKHTDSQLHKYYTGVDNGLILENLRSIDKAGAHIILRCPIIPEVNDNNEHFKQIGALAESLFNVSEINVIPYHSLGIGKYTNIGREAQIFIAESNGEEQIKAWCSKISEFTGIPVKQV
jgi:glycyl-radical enzyme activating protein